MKIKTKTKTKTNCLFLKKSHIYHLNNLLYSFSQTMLTQMVRIKFKKLREIIISLKNMW